jgi:hypothetical protein
LACEGVVSPLVVVVLEPWLQGLGARVVGGEDLPVGPFGLEGSVESFDFAVVPGAVGSNGDVFGSELCDDGGNGMVQFHVIIATLRRVCLMVSSLRLLV